MPREPLDSQEGLRSLCAEAWPPVGPDLARPRVIVSTPWEAAWAQVGLPR